jgi:glycosidase
VKKTARTPPDFLKDSIVYQLFLRPFTPEGTINAAAQLLPYIAELGVDIVYLCPVVTHDDDLREELWSDRQHKSGQKNPKNPYRLKDYFEIEEEYGTADDLKCFVRKAHELGMRVLLDLVYFHCGPTANFIEEHPDFVKRDQNGAVINGKWHFPELNFESKELREYLWENMEYFIKEFQVDGYRCDVATAVPLDFWEEGRKRMELLDPDCIMISEGDRSDDQLAAFDLNYAFSWKFGVIKLLNEEITACELRGIWEKMNGDFPEGARFLRIMDDHDITNDCYDKRHNAVFSPKGVEAILLLNLTIDGVPFIYNGMEIADATRHSIFGNRYFGKNMLINWSKALTEQGQSRFAYLQELIQLRRSIPALTEGSVKWLDNDQSDSILSFARETEDSAILVVINATDKPVTTNVTVNATLPMPQAHFQYGSDYLFEQGDLKLNLLPYGCAVLEY